MEEPEAPDILSGQECPMCHEKTLTLMESQRDIPYFGLVYLFSMTCSNCKYFTADIETAEKHEPSRYTLDVTNEEDLKIRVIRSSTGTIKIPHIMTLTPGPGANGFVSNVEGIINRAKHQVEELRDNDDDPDNRKKAKNMLKKINKVLWGQEKIKLIVEDPEGNSAIISEKAVKKKL